MNILIAMSGGVDSTVAALLLKKQGHNLIGVTYRPWDSMSTSCLEKETGCCSADAIFGAKKVAEDLGFEHHIIDFRNEFKKTVIKDFVEEYLSGNTPNPCVVCNSDIKWGILLNKAKELNCDYIATGHYAQIKSENGRFFMAKGLDALKDQTYFLWKLNEEQLSRTLFPLGELNKDEVKKIAKEAGFVKQSEGRESQEICFIPDNDYRRFISEEVPEKIEKIGEGDFVLSDGTFMGKHKGFPFYTIGQRKGLNVAAGYPLYVLKIDAKNNLITLGKKEELLETIVKVKDINSVKYEKLEPGMKFDLKIRYRTPAVSAEIKSIDKEVVTFVCNTPIAAVTPGQSAVFYENDDLVGGGVIL